MRILPLYSNEFARQNRASKSDKYNIAYKNNTEIKDTVSFGISSPKGKSALKTIKEIFTSLNGDVNPTRTIEQELQLYKGKANDAADKLLEEVFPTVNELKFSPFLEEVDKLGNTKIMANTDTSQVEFLQVAEDGKQLNSVYVGVQTPVFTMTSKTPCEQPLEKFAFIDRDNDMKAFSVTRYKDSSESEILEMDQSV